VVGNWWLLAAHQCHIYCGEIVACLTHETVATVRGGTFGWDAGSCNSSFGTVPEPGKIDAERPCRRSTPDRLIDCFDYTGPARSRGRFNHCR
jgi:hypothetical protein